MADVEISSSISSSIDRSSMSSSSSDILITSSSSMLISSAFSSILTPVSLTYLVDSLLSFAETNVLSGICCGSNRRIVLAMADAFFWC